MTNKEAREILERYIRCSNSVCPPVDCDECQDHVTAKQLDEALQVALEALKEPKQPDHIAVVSKKDDENGDDLIRREDALMSLTGEWTESRDEILSKAIRRIKRLPSAQPELQWIPCSERLPEEETDVIVCSDKGKIGISRGSWSTELQGKWIWYTEGWRFGKVIAWLQLPEPYKPQQEDNT